MMETRNARQKSKFYSTDWTQNSSSLSPFLIASSKCILHTCSRTYMTPINLLPHQYQPSYTVQCTRNSPSRPSFVSLPPKLIDHFSFSFHPLQTPHSIHPKVHAYSCWMDFETMREIRASSIHSCCLHLDHLVESKCVPPTVPFPPP